MWEVDLINTVEDAKELVGQVWERDGKKREVTRIENLRASHGYVHGNVYWRRPGGKERGNPKWLPYYGQWLSKATRISV